MYTNLATERTTITFPFPLPHAQEREKEREREREAAPLAYRSTLHSSRNSATLQHYTST